MFQPTAEAYPFSVSPGHFNRNLVRRADGEVSGPKGPPWELRDGEIFQCMTAITSLARAAARECSLCEQVPASIEVRCRHSNASRAALWLQQKHCTALCSKGDTTIELAGRLFLLTPHVVA